MANTLGTIAVDLQANTVAFVEGMTRASSAAKKAGRDITESFSRLGELAGSALAPFGEVGRIIGETIGRIGALGGSAAQSLAKVGGGMSYLAVGAGAAVGAIAAVTSAAVALSVETAESIRKMGEQAEATGVSVQTLSGLAFAAKEAGLGEEALEKSLGKLSLGMLKAATATPGTVTAFDRLGIKVKQSNGELRDAGVVFEEVIVKLDKLKSRTEAVAFAREIFGRGGQEILKFNPEELEHSLEVARKLGLVLNDEAVVASTKFVQSMIELKGAAEGAAIKLETALLPQLQAVADALVKAAESPSSNFNEFISGIKTLTQYFISFGGLVVFVFEEIGAAIAAVIYDIGTMAEVLARVSARAAKLDFTGAQAAHKEALDKLEANERQFNEHSKANWKTYTDLLTNAFKDSSDSTVRGKNRSGIANIEPSEVDKVIERIKAQIDALKRHADAELTLAASTAQSVAAQRLQVAAGEAELEIGKLLEEANGAKGPQKAKALALIKEETSLIRALTAERLVAKDAVSLDKEFTKVTEAYDAQVTSLRNLTIAYTAGGTAIASAEIGQKLEGEKEKLAILNEEFALLSKQESVSSAATFDLAVAIDNANKQLAFHAQQLKLVNEQRIDVEIARSADALREETPLLQGLSTAYLQSAAAIRSAEVELRLFQFTQQNPGASGSQIDAMRAQYKTLSDQAYQTRIAQEAAQFSITRGFQDEITRLTDVRTALRIYGEDTIRVDAAIYDAQQRNIQQWDVAALKVGTYGEKFRAVMNQVVLDGQNLGEKLFESLGRVINDLSTQLAKFVVTGKNDFKSMIQSFEESIVKASFQKLFSTIVGKLGIPGIGGGAKRDGSSESSALFVQMAGGGKFGIPAGDGGSSSDSGSSGSFSDIISSIGSKISSVFSSIVGTISGIISKIGSSLGSIFGGIGSIFGGFLADGGDVTPGKAYIVGERHPEFFVPKQSGQITPTLKTGGTNHHTSVVMHINGVTDFDSFKRSSGQIMAGLQRQIAIAHARNS